MTLYSTNCPRCKVLEKKIDRLQIEYNVCEDVDRMIELGFTAAPVLETDDGKFLTFEEAFDYVSKLGGTTHES